MTIESCKEIRDGEWWILNNLKTPLRPNSRPINIYNMSHLAPDNLNVTTWQISLEFFVLVFFLYNST